MMTRRAKLRPGALASQAWAAQGVAIAVAMAANSALFAVPQTQEAFPPTDSENPYLTIVAANVFKLKPPPPPPDPVVNQPPPPKLFLTGIMTIFGKKQALMKAPPAGPPKPGETPKEQYYMLSEKERSGDVEVVEIDEKASRVTVITAGVTQTLTFSTNAPSMAAAPVPMPQTIPSPAGFTPNPVAGSYNPSWNARPVSVPSRNFGSAGAGAVNPANAGLIAPSVSAGGQTLNLGGPGSQGSVYTAAVDPAFTGLKPEEYGLLLEVERERTKEQVKAGQIAPIPITQFTPRGAIGTVQEEQDQVDPNTGSPEAAPAANANRVHRRR